MTIDHIGYAVKRLDRAKRAFEDLGYRFEREIEDPDRNVLLQFGEKDGLRIELVAPLLKTAPSPVDAYLGKIGPTPYHICYRTDDLEGEIEALGRKGFRVTVAPAPAVAFRGRRVVFLMNLGLGLIELVEN